MSGRGHCHRHNGCSFLLIFVSAVFLLSSIGNGSCCFGAKTNDEIILPIEIWDVDGKRMEDNNLYQRPRFVITAVTGGKTGTVQPSTFDLGNPNQMILVAQYCQSCSNDNNDNNNNNNGCPLPVPMECQDDNRMTTTLRSQKSQTQTCAPSWPHGFVPASDLTFPTNEKEFVSFTDIHSDASLKEPSSAGKMKYPPNQSPERDVSMQCFNNATHSRYTISATLNTLSFLDPKVSLHDQSQPTTTALSSVPTTTTTTIYHTMENVKIGALVRTVPQIDRVWSNIGIGYHSQFLNQIQSRAVLILPDNKTSPTNKGSTIVFNAKKERYSHWSSTYFQVMFHRRVHSNLDIRIASSPPSSSSSTKKIDSWNPLENEFFPYEGYRKAFHIDTGNDGIALQSTRIQQNLAKSTGGLWISKLDLLDMFPTVALDDRFFHDDEHTMKFLVVPTAFAQHDKHTDNNDDDVTDLIVELSSTVHVRIPTNRWILPPAKKDDEEPQLFVPTIFFTYAKNVLGLPFILATEGMAYDDENHSIHIQKNDYQQLS